MIITEKVTAYVLPPKTATKCIGCLVISAFFPEFWGKNTVIIMEVTVYGLPQKQLQSAWETLFFFLGFKGRKGWNIVIITENITDYVKLQQIGKC